MGTAVVMTNGMVRSPKQPLTSVARTVKVNRLAVVGVPEIAPPAESVRPAGSAPPVTVKVCGATQPLAVSVWLYATPTVPLGSVP